MEMTPEMRQALAAQVHQANDPAQPLDPLSVYQALYEHSAQGVMVTTATTASIVAVNPAFCRITGYRSEQVLGRTPRLLQSGWHARDFYIAMWAALRESNQWQGEIWNRHSDGSVHRERLQIHALRDAQQQVTHYVGIFSEVNPLQENKPQLAELALHDPLTGLANRSAFRQQLQQLTDQAATAALPVALLWINVDQFNYLNASLGMVGGDVVLQHVGARLTAAAVQVSQQRPAVTLQPQILLARIGGAQFAMAMVLSTPQSEAQPLAQVVNQMLLKPLQIWERQISVTVSIGTALSPRDAQSVDDLMQVAWIACEDAVAAGGDSIRRAPQNQQVYLQRRHEIERGLERALQDNALSLLYQPKIDLHTQRLCGAEAFLRWQRPNGDWVAPNEFIPVAEASGQILEIGDWVVRAVLRQLRRWQDTGLTPVPVAINLSAPELKREEAVERLRRMLQQNRVEAQLIELELTESQLVSDVDQVVQVLKALHDLGVSIAVDDFGTGLTSVGMLGRFPLTRLKIDHSFVARLDSEAGATEVVKAIIQLGHSFGLRVTAEGVETQAQLSLLTQLGCDEGQGYLFGRPVTAEAFAALFNQ